MNDQDFSMFRSRLVSAFRLLRSRGIMARANFYCCGSCAVVALTTMAVEKIKGGLPKEKIKGCVFWSKQDDARLNKHGYVYLNFGALESVEFGTIGLPTVEVGRMVVAALDEVRGIHVTWDGSAMSSIQACDPSTVDEGGDDDA